jgi:hypothetical protein
MCDMKFFDMIDASMEAEANRKDVRFCQYTAQRLEA